MLKLWWAGTAAGTGMDTVTGDVVNGTRHIRDGTAAGVRGGTIVRESWLARRDLRLAGTAAGIGMDTAIGIAMAGTERIRDGVAGGVPVGTIVRARA